MATLQIRSLRKSFGPVEVIKGVDLDVEDREFVVFVGPSGCGKSTLLRMIAGLEEITSGELMIDGVLSNDVPPDRRGLAMVFQSYALYPHMTVADNMGFALRLAGVPKAERMEKIRAAARTLRLEELLERRPRELSGGQRQRVAIGRAIVREPKAFLFDEPLSNLDAALRVQMRIELGKLQASLGTTSIYVTHDQVEAMTMADKIVVINAGRIEQIGAPIDLYDRPDNLFVAGFIGSPKMNLIGGRLAAGLGAETVGVRPEHIAVSEHGGTWTGTLSVAEHVGSDTFLYVAVEGAEEIAVRLPGDVRLDPGATVHLVPEPDRIHRFDSDGRAIRQ